MHYLLEFTTSRSTSRLTLYAYYELPRAVILGNSFAYTRIPVRDWGVWWPHVCSPSFLVNLFSVIRPLLGEAPSADIR